jgi:hypothetical protein
MGARILVHLFRDIGVFGLRRAALKEKDRQDHIGGHLQKLAFPVFKHGGPEMATREIRAVADSGLPVGVLIGVVVVIPRETVPEEEQKE